LGIEVDIALHRIVFFATWRFMTFGRIQG